MPRRVVIGIILALLVVGAAIALRGRPMPVEMAEAATMTVREYITEEAKTRLDSDYLIAMPITGTVERIDLEPGDPVKAGSCVAKVESLEIEEQIKGLQARIGQVEAQITSVDVTKPKDQDIESAAARAEQAEQQIAIIEKEQAIVDLEYADAQKNYERAKDLYEQGAMSQQQYEAAERAFRVLERNRQRAALASSASGKSLKVAELSLDRLKDSIDDNEYMREAYRKEIEAIGAQIAILQNNLEKTHILSPVDGYLLEKYVEDERALMAGTPLMRLGDLNTVEIECDVLSEEVVAIEEGDKVEVTGKALSGETVIGEVKRVYPAGFMKLSVLGIEQQRVRVLITFDNSEVKLRPGTSIDCSIITDEAPDAVAVPERAVFRNDGGWAVFVVDGGKARLTPVEVGLKNDDWAQIVSGVEPGETIVADPKNELEDGVRITNLKRS